MNKHDTTKQCTQNALYTPSNRILSGYSLSQDKGRVREELASIRHSRGINEDERFCLQDAFAWREM